MGYFDKAMEDIVELDEEEYLEHSRFGSFRKKHKYIDRIWKNGRWVYRYKITGKGYKDDASKYGLDSAYSEVNAKSAHNNKVKRAASAYVNAVNADRNYQNAANATANAVNARNHANGISGTSDKAKADKKYWNDAADQHENNAKYFTSIENNYASKMRADKRAAEHESHMEDVWSGRAERSAKKAEKSMDDYYNKSLAGTVEKIKKKLKHDDILDSLAYGEAILHSMFN